MKKINICFFILLILFIQVILTDTLIYFTHISYGIANVIASVINISFAILCIKKKWIKIETNFNKWDIIFFVLLVTIIAITIIFPDNFWDSYSYHLYLQENPFTDKINDDFFPGRTLTSFIFPIADRIFYMFRNLLGFRLGTLPGYLLLAVMFYQCKKILLILTKEKIEEKYLSILSILPLCAFVVLQRLGTYYIDNFSIVFLLEFVYIILNESKGILKNKSQLYYLALIVGITVCIKITNAIYMVFPLLYLLIINIKDIKQIKWYDYILLIITAVLPMLPYLLDAIIQTGSPVFPYYNTIFKSEYFEEINWIDTRFGPKNIIQLLLWPIYIAKHPEKSCEIGYVDGGYVFGYIVVGIYLIYLLYKAVIKKEKINTKVLLYSLLLVYLYLVWAKFIIGYARYGGVITVLSMILIVKLLTDVVQNQKYITIIVLSTMIFVSTRLGIYQTFYYSSLYNYSSAIQVNVEVKPIIKENINKVFKDRKNVKYDIEGIWGVIYDDSAVPMLLNVDDRLVNLEYNFKTGNSKKNQSIYWQNVLNNDIYVPLYDLKMNGKIQYLDKFHFEITEIVEVLENVEFLQGESKIYIVKVKYNEEISSENKQIFEELQAKIEQK